VLAAQHPDRDHAQDRPGLLYDISSTMAELGCNIEVAIIDTQGQTATVCSRDLRRRQAGPQTPERMRTALLGNL